MNAVSSILRHMTSFLSTWRFPTFALSVLFFFHAVVLVIAVFPFPQGGALAGFADDFRVWCFGYDPATGKYEWAYVAMLLAEPIVMGSVLVAIWYEPLRDVLRRSPGAVVPHVGAAFAVVVVAAASLVGMRGEAYASAGAEFPAASLRTAGPAPELRLTSHTGQPLDSSDLRGNVVVLTGVYASCGTTCPMILGQTKRVLARLSDDERRNLRVVGVTLDPAHDDTRVLSELARAQGVSAPLFQLVTGAPADVDGVLDALGIARRKNPDTGVIDHANLFVVIDRAGRVAYRFTLGATQERWLSEALRLLLREPAGARP